MDERSLGLMPLIHVKNLSVNFASATGVTKALKDVKLHVLEGEVVSIIGPSGCGKSTLLNAISGLRAASGGEIFHRGVRISGPSRQRVLIFQNHALFPWLTARANVAFSLHARVRNKTELQDKVEHYLELVGLREFQNFYPAQLSGGMRQRIGIARALAAEPEVLLLDEPFASLDVIRREELLQEVLRLVKKMKMSMILVTHDIEEAMFMGDRLYLMSGRPGRVVKSIEIEHSKPNKIIELKQQREFRSLEMEIHEHLDEVSR